MSRCAGFILRWNTSFARITPKCPNACDGVPVGYATVYLTNDMHNGEKIATEDTLYVLKQHRSGIGRRLVKHVLDYLRANGFVRLSISATTDLRVVPLFRRMGFKEVAMQMAYVF